VSEALQVCDVDSPSFRSPFPMRKSSVYGVMSSRRGKEKWVLTFSFIIVTMLKVYRMVLKLRMRGSFLKQALREEGSGTDNVSNHNISTGDIF